MEYIYTEKYTSAFSVLFSVAEIVDVANKSI